MALTIIAIILIFIVCAVYAYRAKTKFPTFTDEQLLNQHLRFLDELESSRKYIGATYFHTIEKGSQGQAELRLRGYDVNKLLQEHAAAERDCRDMNWETCKIRTDRSRGAAELEKTVS